MAKSDGEKVLGEQLGTRILYAHMLLSQAEDEHVPLAEFGERVAKEEQRIDKANATAKPYAASSVSRWESGESEPGLLTLLAIVSLVNRALASARRKDRIDPGWLAFGSASEAKAPEMPTFTLAGLAEIRASGRRGRRG